MTMPALFAVESGASVKQVQPPVIQGKRKDDTLLSGDDTFLSVNNWRHPLWILPDRLRRISLGKATRRDDAYDTL